MSKRFFLGLIIAFSIFYYGDLKPTFYNPIATPETEENVLLILFSFAGGFLTENFGLFAWAIPVLLFVFKIREGFQAYSLFFEATLFFSSAAFAAILLNSMEFDAARITGGFGAGISANIPSVFAKMLICFFAVLFFATNFFRYELTPSTTFFISKLILLAQWVGKTSSQRLLALKSDFFQKKTDALREIKTTQEAISEPGESLLNSIVSNDPLDKSISKNSNLDETPDKTI